MKKTYSTPQTTVIAIATQQMIAESIAVGNSYNGDEVGSRRGSYWDDDDE